MLDPGVKRKLQIIGVSTAGVGLIFSATVAARSGYHLTNSAAVVGVITGAIVSVIGFVSKAYCFVFESRSKVTIEKNNCDAQVKIASSQAEVAMASIARDIEIAKVQAEKDIETKRIIAQSISSETDATQKIELILAPKVNSASAASALVGYSNNVRRNEFSIEPDHTARSVPLPEPPANGGLKVVDGNFVANNDRFRFGGVTPIVP